ncbi:hypothetical protein CANCADRAFT_1136 [Tortispora caseinolytica NRRL Y-17796]|uniref:Septation initiation network scaffold protein cdc11 n=1 Tax=Tortispora caseinolytica NRRL Y-17796 TaxID=767744 RepID=A0A1E4TLF1_9ASCO|nr:hypothetical protein CANCADRAFT_1136 [Tortispora caseinolytica NRRL Y-17796]
MSPWQDSELSEEWPESDSESINRVPTTKFLVPNAESTTKVSPDRKAPAAWEKHIPKDMFSRTTLEKLFDQELNDSLDNSDLNMSTLNINNRTDQPNLRMLRLSSDSLTSPTVDPRLLSNEDVTRDLIDNLNVSSEFLSDSQASQDARSVLDHLPQHNTLSSCSTAPPSGKISEVFPVKSKAGTRTTLSLRRSLSNIQQKAQYGTVPTTEEYFRNAEAVVSRLRDTNHDLSFDNTTNQSYIDGNVNNASEKFGLDTIVSEQSSDHENDLSSKHVFAKASQPYNISPERYTDNAEQFEKRSDMVYDSIKKRWISISEASTPQDLFPDLSVSLSEPVNESNQKHNPLNNSLQFDSEDNSTLHTPDSLFQDIPHVPTEQIEPSPILRNKRTDQVKVSSKAYSRPSFGSMRTSDIDITSASLLDISGSESKRKLIRVISTAAPFSEPGYLEVLNISGQQLSSIADLPSICPNIAELDISNNEMEIFDPHFGLNATKANKGEVLSVRYLNAENNILSDRTSFATFANVQRLNISHNRLESLSALAQLVHLRELNVNYNKLKSLDHILHLDGLIKLSASGNNLSIIDFTNSKLLSLESLIVSHNEVTIIKGMNSLPRLAFVDLSYNKLESIDSSAESSSPSCRVIIFSNNHLRALNIKGWPQLRALYADSNMLTNVEGLHSARHLQTLNLANQRPTNGNSAVQFPKSLDVKRLNLSDNVLDLSWQNSNDIYLNLKVLDLSGCNLAKLPKQFGLLFPNLRRVDLSHNQISDLSPLFLIRRLANISLINNEIVSHQHLLQVLLTLKELRQIDLRLNPVTSEYYTSLKATGTGQSGQYKIVPKTDMSLEQKNKYNKYVKMILTASPRLRSLDGIDLTSD